MNNYFKTAFNIYTENGFEIIGLRHFLTHLPFNPILEHSMEPRHNSFIECFLSFHMHGVTCPLKTRNILFIFRLSKMKQQLHLYRDCSVDVIHMQL